MSHYCRPMRAFLIWGASAAAVMGALGAQAAVLGHSRVISAPEQPLRIAVQLKDLSPEEMESLTVTIAPTSAWQEAGLKAPVDLSSFRLITAAAAQANALQLILESSQVSTLPIIDVLLEVKTPISTQRHQVSVLQAPLPAPVVLTQTAAVRSETAAAPAPTVPAVETPETAITTHQVRSGQTLSHLAQRYRSSQYSDQQFMVALLEANPQAFIHGNLNLVRAEATLTLPHEQAIAAISPAQARQVYQTHLQWFNDYRQRVAHGQPLPSMATQEPFSSSTPSATSIPAEAEPVTSVVPEAASDRLQLSANEPHNDQAAQQLALAQELAHSAERLAELEAPLATAASVDIAAVAHTEASIANIQSKAEPEPASVAASVTTQTPTSTTTTIQPTSAANVAEAVDQAAESQSGLQRHLGWALALLVAAVLFITWFLRRANTSRLDVLDELTPSAARMRDKLEKNNDNFAPQTDEVEFREIK